ncbi:lipocalin family protein [Asticcacaulis sp. BYS171W]|uniref:Outer membrane lipoprotein Blc n=1 Tax=Asticcacaulis aquaticus TaxID=2984212 RepID=A0ABT5HX09_9CAUL|nr:lipocalin family protein [Asticcacaulis aquaticus]MDC7684610.1 lipocalin family protein [Asticcacaulis aquaticus]
MKPQRAFLPLILLAAAVTACAAIPGGPVGNHNVPQPSKPVDLTAYSGLWYEVARYENAFEKDCEGVRAEYSALPDGQIRVVNTCRKGSITAEKTTSEGKAKVVAGSGNAKLKVSFAGPFYIGNYWVLDRADDYSWSIVGEPSGRYLWILSRTANPSPEVWVKLETRAAELGYDRSLIRPTRH